MSKPFFEVFPTLKVKDDIQMMFQGVEVTKVSTNSTRDFAAELTAFKESVADLKNDIQYTK